jgi:uncharacterized glyoxalase superfamily protein PhnB
VKPNRSIPAATVIPVLIYPDVREAVEWLSTAFGYWEYGERQYVAEDPAGHRWTFSETLDDVAPAEWGGTLVEPG